MDGFGAGLKMRSKMLRNRKPSLQFPPRLTGHWPAQPKLFCSSDEFHLQLPQSNQLHTLQWCIITVRGWITPAFAALLTCTRTREHFAYRSPDRLHNCSCKPKCSKVIIKKKTVQNLILQHISTDLDWLRACEKCGSAAGRVQVARLTWGSRFLWLLVGELHYYVAYNISGCTNLFCGYQQNISTVFVPTEPAAVKSGRPAKKKLIHCQVTS